METEYRKTSKIVVNRDMCVHVLQEVSWGPCLYTSTELTEVSSFAHDTATLSSAPAPDASTAFIRFQTHRNLFKTLLQKSRMRVNEESQPTPFTLNHTSCPPVAIKRCMITHVCMYNIHNRTLTSQASEVKCLGLNFDHRLT